jgi:hypothetical protein
MHLQKIKSAMPNVSPTKHRNYSLDTVAEEIKLVNAIIHSLHVLIDVRPCVRACAKGRQIPRLLNNIVKVKFRRATLVIFKNIQEAWGFPQIPDTDPRQDQQCPVIQPLPTRRTWWTILGNFRQSQRMRLSCLRARVVRSRIL